MTKFLHEDALITNWKK